MPEESPRPCWLVSRRALLPTDQEETDPSYRAALAWIWRFSEDRQLAGAAQREDPAQKLARMRALLATLGNPQHSYPALLVAGTKGKGSTVAFLDAALRQAGWRTGRYTSPHLLNWRERTCVSGEPISPDEVCALTERVRGAVAHLDPCLGRPGTFEIGTVLSLAYFQARQVDVAVLEVGVGGAYDATNVVDSLVAGIVSVSLDHLRTLGPDLASIASQKAGILRPGRAGVIGPVPPEAEAAIRAVAQQRGSRLVWIGRDWRVALEQTRPPVVRLIGPDQVDVALQPGLRGRHQAHNLAVAAAMLEELGRVRPDLATPRAALAAGACQVVWPGRLHVVACHPLVVLDGAHNGASAAALRQALDDLYPEREVHVLFGTSEDKDVPAMLGSLAPRARSLTLTRSRHERARAPALLVKDVALAAASPLTTTIPVQVADDVASGLERVMAAAGPQGLVLVTGSLFVVGEALRYAGVQQQQQEQEQERDEDDGRSG